ncbi:hypothetical protein N0V83_010268 [Neocucurbitaria cava]|uniref:Uncharacterized protein n=1 Tax=Neocucurbitaria cava TaxID=798079 RepID=A0A9W9CHZ5_9PLEO|nr:hypothetical protein N0V83_010268 [Neocucurbitaria cava]
MTGPDKQGFFSGFQPVDKVLDDPPKYTVTVNDTNPIFFYCSAPGSCITYSMVGAINPNSSTSIDTQHQLALNSTYMLNPGEPFPAESPLPSSNPASTALPGGNTGKKDLAAGAIAGIVIATLSVVVLAALLFFFWGKTKTLKDEVDRKESTVVRRVSPDSSTAMLEASRRNGGGGGGGGGGAGSDGLGIYQHYTPTATYFSPQEPQQQQQQQQLPAKFHLTSPTLAEHPAFSNAPYSPETITSPNANNVQRAISPLSHHTHSPTDFDLRPSLTSIPSTSDYYYPAHHNQLTPLLPPNPHSSRTISPPPQDAYKLELGPYGRQVTGNSNNEPAPSYFEAVHRPGPVHVNGRMGMGPVEMDGSSGVEGVQKGVKGGVVDAVVERPRWEEVSVDGEGKMF